MVDTIRCGVNMVDTSRCGVNMVDTSRCGVNMVDTSRWDRYGGYKKVGSIWWIQVGVGSIYGGYK